MKIVTTTELAGTTTRLVFSNDEVRALREVSRIAGAARDMCAEEVGHIDWEDTDEDTELANIEHGAASAALGYVIVETFGDGLTFGGLAEGAVEIVDLQTGDVRYATPGLLEEDLQPMTPEQIAWVRSQRTR